jgi:Na+/H+ antiporter NhaA
MRVGIIRLLFRHDAASGILSMLASAVALVLANSPLFSFGRARNQT